MRILRNYTCSVRPWNHFRYPHRCFKSSIMRDYGDSGSESSDDQNVEEVARVERGGDDLNDEDTSSDKSSDGEKDSMNENKNTSVAKPKRKRETLSESEDSDECPTEDDDDTRKRPKRDEEEGSMDTNASATNASGPVNSRSDPYSESEMQEFERHRDALSCLGRPYSEEEITKLTEADLLGMLKSMESMWNLDDTQGFEDVNRLLRLTRRNLGYAEEDTALIDPSDIEVAKDKVGIFKVQKLQVFFLQLNLIQAEKHDQYMKRFFRLFDVIHHCGELLYSTNRALYLMQGRPQAAYSDNMFRFRPMTDFAENNRSTNFVIYILNELQKRQYRKLGDHVYAPIFNKKKQFTYAWDRISSIEEFVFSSVNITSQYRQFLDAVSNMNTMKDTAKFLKHFKTDMFPELQPNRYLFAFENGVYYTSKDQFIPYDSISADNVGNFWIGSDKFDSRYVCCNFFPYDFVPHTTEDLFNSHEGLKENLEKDYPDTASREEFLEKLKCFDIPTPLFDMILQNQGFDEDTITVLCGMLGRCLYWGGELDEWQCCLFLLGYGGTGKSTILKLLRQIYRLENVGILSNNVERQWALSSIWDKYVVLGYEVKQDFRWEQGEFQSCISMEEVSVMVKHSTAFAHRFNAHIFLAGNEMVSNWRDNSKSLARRFVIATFHKHIPIDQIRPHLLRDMEKELPYFLQKINKFYRYLTNKHGKSGIMSKLPQKMKDMHEEAMESMNPLVNFIRNSNVFLNGRDRYCKFDDFIKLFNKFCETENYKKAKFTKDFYKGVFDELGYQVKTDLRDYDGKMIHTRWIEGLDIVPYAKESISIHDLPRKISAFAAGAVPSISPRDSASNIESTSPRKRPADSGTSNKPNKRVVR